MNLRCVILDDYQNVAFTMADWNSISNKVEFNPFNRHFDNEDKLVSEETCPWQSSVGIDLYGKKLGLFGLGKPLNHIWGMETILDFKDLYGDKSYLIKFEKFKSLEYS